MNWWYAKGDQKAGPLDDAAFRMKIQDGTVLPDDLVWNETMATWSRAREVSGLFDEASTPGLPYAGDGNTPNRDLMRLARESLSGRWGLAIGVIVLLALAPQAVAYIPCLGPLVVLAASGALQYGQQRFFLAYARREPADLGLAFSGFKMFGKCFLTFLLVNVFVFLWMLLLIIPGVIKSLSYSMTWFILADNPGIDPMQAIDRSIAMMDGRKWKLFCLSFRFIGWAVLAILTLGIGFLWLAPYMQTAVAHFYDDVKRRVPAVPV
jgi:uncharacterized membrane protein